MSILIIGAGLAGLRTAAELRAAHFTGHLRVLGAEAYPPYDRPPLSKELFTRPDPVWLSDDLNLRLDDLADDVRLSTTASALELTSTRARVHTESGEVFDADTVIAATGSSAVLPPEFEQARTLHSLDDAAALRSELTGGARLAVIGAGWIGAEVAGVAAEAGCTVTVVEAGRTPLARQLGHGLGERTIDWYTEAGVDVRTCTTVTAVSDGIVRLADGNLPTDVVLCAVGARPNTQWLTTALPVTATGHLRVDAAGRSAHPRVWAVGDVAERAHPVFGRIPGSHWSAALTDPVPLARALLGVPNELGEPAPYVFSTQLGHHVSVFGRITDDRVTREFDGPWTTLMFDRDALVGAVIADAPREVAAVRKLLGKGTLPHLDRARATDPATALRDAVTSPASGQSDGCR